MWVEARGLPKALSLEEICAVVCDVTLPSKMLQAPPMRPHETQQTARIIGENC